MKLSLSKTISFGPFKLTASKSGLTASVGIPGLRTSVNTKGEVGLRAGVPGIKGLAYQKKKKVF